MVSSISSLDHLGVMTNHLRRVMHLGVGLLALGHHLLHTLLNVGGVHNGLAHLSGDLGLLLLGHLVALVLNMVLALRSRGVARWISLSISLVVSTMRNHLGVMTNNSAAMVNLLVGLLAVLGHNLLTLLNVGGVNLDVILSVTLLSLLLDWLLVALPVGLAMALLGLAVASIATRWSSQAQGRQG